MIIKIDFIAYINPDWQVLILCIEYFSLQLLFNSKLLLIIL